MPEVTRFSLALVSLLVVAPLARAQDTDGQGRIHFQAGTNYFQIADYESALREFQRAYDLSQRADLLYNLYLCHERLGNLSEAVAHLERYLAEGTDVPNRELLQRRLRTMRTRLAAQVTEPEPEPEPEIEIEIEREPEPEIEREPEPTSTPEPEPPVASSRSSTTVIIDTTGGHGGGVPGGAITMFVFGGLHLAGGAALGVAAIVEDAAVGSMCNMMCTSRETEVLEVLVLSTDIVLGIGASFVFIGVIWALAAGGGGDEPSVLEARVAPWVDGSGGGVSGMFAF